MKYLRGNYYVEVKVKRYKSHPNENNILRLHDPPKTLRIRNQVKNETAIRKNEKVIGDDNIEKIVT